MLWNIRKGGGKTPINFQGMGGTIRPLRVDEMILSFKEGEQDLQNAKLCTKVLGRKAFRTGEDEGFLSVFKEGLKKLNGGAPLDEVEDLIEVYSKRRN